MSTCTMPSTPEARGAVENPRRDQRPTLRPAANIYEVEDAYVVTMDLPGVAKDQVDILIDKNTLLVKATSAVSEPEGLRATWREYRHGAFARSFAMGPNIDAGAIEAQLTTGILTLRLPKRAEAQPQRIAVN